jgi:hypothetical protein
MRYISLALFLFLGGTVALAQTDLTTHAVTTQIDGRALTLDQPAVMRDGRVLVPLRGVLESLGAQVGYNPASKTITATRNGEPIALVLDSNTASIGGRPVALDVPATSINGRTMVPLRFVAEALGAGVTWNAASRTVAIVSPQPVQVAVMQPAPAPVPPPQAAITSVTHSAAGALGQGDVLKVSMIGTPGGQASFDLAGVADDVAMREVAPGSYEGQIRVKPGMDLSQGNVVAHLTVNGTTAQKSAQRAVTMDSHSTVAGGMTVSPARGAMASSETPMIKAQFSRNVRPESIKVFVNGRDVSTRAHRQPDSVTYIPDPRLTSGEQTVAVQAVDDQGRSLSQQWTFRVAGTTGDGNRPPLSVTNLGSGHEVGETFDVEGRTAPNSTVKITAERNGALQPQAVTMEGKADDGGNFDIELDVSAIPLDSTLDVEVLSIDNEGDVSTPVNMQLLRR